MENTSKKLLADDLRNALIIDADETMHTLVRNYLTVLGVNNVVCVKDGEEAKAEVAATNFQLILLDWKHKNPPGIEIFKALRRNQYTTHVPVILMSGQITIKDVQIVKEDGNSTFLSKPFTQEILEGVVRKTMRNAGVAMQAASQGASSAAKLKLIGGGGSMPGSDLYIDKKDLVTKGYGIFVDRKPQSIAANTTFIAKKAAYEGFDAEFQGEGEPVDDDLMAESRPGAPRGRGLFVDKGQGRSGGDPYLDKGPGVRGGDPYLAKGKVQEKQDPFVDKKADPGNGFSFAEKKPDSGEFSFSDNKAKPQGSGWDATFSSASKLEDDEPLFIKRHDANDFSFDDKPQKFAKDAVLSADEDDDGFSFDAPRTAAGGDDLRVTDPTHAGSFEYGLQKAKPGSDMSYRGTRKENKQPGPATGGKNSEGNALRPETGDGDDDVLIDGGESLQDPFAPIPGGRKRKPAGEGVIEYDGKEAKSVKPAQAEDDMEGLSVHPFVLRNALVVDNDASVQNLLRNYLGQRGVKHVQVCPTAEVAWQHFQERSFDIVIMEWRMRGMSGLCLYNRIRKSSRRKVKILVTTGFVKREDFRLLEESSLTGIIEKPFQLRTLDRVINDLNNRQKNFLDVSEGVKKLLASVSKTTDTKELVRQVLSKAQDPFNFSVAAGELFYKADKLEEAEHFYKVAQKIHPRNATVITQLGKIYQRTGRGDKAYAILKGATYLSSQSVERLCLMGELGLSLQKPEEARKYFREVLVIDASDNMAMAGMTLSENMEQYLQESNEPLTTMFASALNVVGVTLARKNQIARALEQYKAAMAFVHDGDNLSKIKFNAGLSYMRARNYLEAYKWFQDSVRLSNGNFHKAVEYRDLIAEKYLHKKPETKTLSSANVEIKIPRKKKTQVPLPSTYATKKPPASKLEDSFAIIPVTPQRKPVELEDIDIELERFDD